MTKPVVLIAEELSPATVEALGPDFEIRQCNGADRAELLAAIGEVDARAGAQRHQDRRRGARRRQPAQGRRPSRRRPRQRRRQAATQSGVMVVNAPTSNIVSAAELAVGLLLAAARHVAPASEALRRGEWKRSKYTGVELYEKTVGIVGLGRIGVLVAQRLSAFGMKVIAYDPYVQAGRAAQLGVRLVEPRRADGRVRLHLGAPAQDARDDRPDRRRAAAQVKPQVIIVNAARGGIVDETRSVLRGQGGPGRRGRARRLRQRAVHRLAAVRVRQRRRHAAPRCLHRRGAGEGRHRGRPVGTAGAGRRAGPRRGQRPGRRHRRGRTARHPADREARPDLHRARRRRRPAPRRRGPRRDHQPRRQGARARGAQGRLRRRRRGERLVRQRAAAGRRARPGGAAGHRRRRAPTTATWSRCAAPAPTAARCRCPAR